MSTTNKYLETVRQLKAECDAARADAAEARADLLAAQEGNERLQARYAALRVDAEAAIKERDAARAEAEAGLEREARLALDAKFWREMAARLVAANTPTAWRNAVDEYKAALAAREAR